MRKVDLNQIFSKKTKSTLEKPTLDVKKTPVKNIYFSSPEFMNSPPAESLPIPNFDDE